MKNRDYDFPQFTPTEHSTVADKEKFARQFIKFVEWGFNRKQFPKWMYKRLSMMFGMVAHYNQAGFYDYYFSNGEKWPAEFIKDVMTHPRYGSPAFTYCDVESFLQNWLQTYLVNPPAEGGQS